ncbi:MAG: NAD(P)-dependent alcohol dehydrogenase [Saprospiraceae bacterium]|nr:NAD(P)-dependent alcohol dehydrogenase [Saprospiraceae bacterium]
MKAAIYKKYGSPDVVQITELSKPVPADDEILIRMYFSTVNRTDTGFRSAEYFISRFWSGLFVPKYQVLGCEFAGIVESTGSNSSSFKVGDAVFGFNDQRFGGHAEYMLAKETDAMAKIPEGISLETAAAIAEGAHYALGNIRASGIQKGQTALVYGATGAIGSAAVQLLKYFGVRVVAVGNTKNIELIRNMGADVVIDYQKEDFTQWKEKYHLVFDAVGKSYFGACRPLLENNGVYISTELGKNGENVWRAVWGKITGGKRILFPIPESKKSDMEFLAARVADGSFSPVIDKTYVLDDIKEAHQYVGSGQKTGNVLIKIR